MHSAELLTYFVNRLGEMLQFSKELVERESPSTDKEAVDSFGRWLAGVYRDLGAHVDIYPAETHGDNLKVTLGDQEEQILILCHMDTVWPLGEIEKRPFRIDGDRVYGPGIYDMKAGFLYTTEVMRAFSHFGARPKKRVVIICNSDEEIGSFSSRGLIEEEAQKSCCVLVLEPSIAGGALKTSRKGQGYFTLKVKGLPAHSGSDHEKGVSAIQEMARHILTIENLTDYASGTTANVGIVSGGSRSNVVPAEAYAEIDVRVTNEAGMRSVESAITGLKPVTPGISLSVQGGFVRPPMVKSEKTAELVAAAQKLASELGFHLPEGATGAGSDGNFTAFLGVPTLDGLGAVGDGSHSLHEHMIVSELPERIALLYRILENF